MKKLSALFISVIIPVTSQAADQKSLVIIDSYFDSRVISDSVKCITPNGGACQYTAKLPFPASISHNTNHGNAMVEVAKKQNPSISIIAISAAGPTSDVNAGHFIESLRWVSANSEKVSAVSISRFFNGPSICSPASVNTAAYGGVLGADKIIKELIVSLKLKGVQVFASTGNKPGTKIDYPACIVDTVSVSTGDFNKSGVLVSANALDANTDFVAPMGVFSYSSNLFKLIPQTTSSATAAVAAQYVTNGVLPSKVVKVLS
jgi:hypothetical protein